MRKQSTLIRVLFVLVLCVVAGWFVRQYIQSQVLGNPYRLNLVSVLRDDSLVFVSFDPQDKQVFTVTYPRQLEITSRSVGSYTMGNLYTLGTYDGDPATFIKRKMQGFMRVPIVGMVESRAETDNVRHAIKQSLWQGFFRKKGATTLTSLDSIVLYFRAQNYEWRESGESDLIRANVIEKKNDMYISNQERLKQFLGTKVFDWAVGQHRSTVAIINESGEDGLATDIAEFLSNLGMDIVAVKSTAEQKDITLIQYSEDTPESRQVREFMRDFFGWNTSERHSLEEYRADFVIRLGKDAIQLF